MGGSREYDAERGMSFGSWKSKYCVGESQISVWRRFTASGNCDIYGSGGTSDSDVWTLWSLFNIRRGNCIGSDERGSGIWRIYAGCDIKSFWKCRKRISFSTWICKSKTVVSTLDSDREWGIFNRKAEKSCEGSWCDSRQDRRLWIEGFSEHGCMYGTGSL